MFINYENKKLRYSITVFVFVVAFLCLFPDIGNAQSAPGDFEIGCQTRCSGPNNDRLNCNNITTSPYVDFTWNPSAGATKYEVYYKNYSLGSWVGPVATTTGTKYSASVPYNSQNHYYIKAINSSGFKSCSINFPAGTGGCKNANENYTASDEGIEANCYVGSVTLTVVVQGNGTVASPYGTCTSNSTCSVTLPIGTSLSLTAQTVGGSTFTGWGGDCSSSGVNVTCSGTISSNRYVTASFSGGPATPTPTPTLPPSSKDNTPPNISNVRVVSITTNSAVVLWETNEPANSQVEYCLTASHCDKLTALSSGKVTSHSVNLSSLTPNTFYYIWARSADGAGNLRIAGFFVFRTLGATGNATPTPTPTPTSVLVPPIIIANAKVSNITRNSATMTWSTDVPSDSRVYGCFYGIFCYTELAMNPNMAIAHSLNLNNLQPDRNYYVKAVSRNANSNGSSSIIKFRTQPGLTVSNVKVINVANSSFTVTWDTNYPADSRITICTITFYCYFSTPIIDANLTLNHSMNVTGLKSGSDYYYMVRSVDPAGYSARSPLGPRVTTN